MSNVKLIWIHTQKTKSIYSEQSLQNPKFLYILGTFRTSYLQTTANMTIMITINLNLQTLPELKNFLCKIYLHQLPFIK